jgi:2-(1,2-epoxy-1,2-dihydrophenyl)acetyl-CoA isomerase
MNAKYETILYEVTDGVATLTMNRPEARNGMTRQMLRETWHALDAVSRDTGVRVLVLTGAGTSFCPGADLARRTTPGGVEDEAIPLHVYQVPVLLHEMPALTIAAVNGACAGAGMGWACGADIRVAARSAMFNTAFLNVAVAGDMGLPWSLPRLVGAARARELSFLSEKFSAEDACRAGLVARVWDDAAFRDEVAAMVANLAARSPVALRTLKQQYVMAERMSYSDYVFLETERHHQLVSSDNAREAMRAFMEKRPPRFAGS